MRDMLRTWRGRAAVLLVGALASAGGVAVAAGTSGNDVIHGCYGKSNGQLRVVAAADDCKNNELPITWNQRGPVGPAGPRGLPGPPGPPGPGANVRTLGQVVVPLNSAKVLFASGPFTVSGRCRTNFGEPNSSSEDFAEVIVTSSESESSFFGPTVALGPHGQPVYGSNTVSATAPSGASISGVVSGGPNVAGHPGACVFGGFVVVG